MSFATTRQGWMDLIQVYRLDKRSFAERHALHCMAADWFEEQGEEETATCLRKGQFSVLRRRRDGGVVIVPFVQGALGSDVSHEWSMFLAYPERLLTATEHTEWISGWVDWTDDGTFTRRAETALTPDGQRFYP
jgi:hypothetical protein